MKLFDDIDSNDLVLVNTKARGCPQKVRSVTVAGRCIRNSIVPTIATDIHISADVASVMGIEAGDRVRVSRPRGKDYVVVLQKAGKSAGTYVVSRPSKSKQLKVRVTGLLTTVQNVTDTKIIGVQEGALAFDMSVG